MKVSVVIPAEVFVESVDAFTVVVGEAVEEAAFVEVITEVGREAVLSVEVVGESVLLVTAVCIKAVDAGISELTVLPGSVLVVWRVDV